tara:strand:- start:1143 stop:1640 length:498 start_codon:yes stop_codon:yes gene_type:complete
MYFGNPTITERIPFLHIKPKFSNNPSSLDGHIVDHYLSETISPLPQKKTNMFRKLSDFTKSSFIWLAPEMPQALLNALPQTTIYLYQEILIQYPTPNLDTLLCETPTIPAPLLPSNLPSSDEPIRETNTLCTTIPRSLMFLKTPTTSIKTAVPEQTTSKQDSLKP